MRGVRPALLSIVLAVGCVDEPVHAPVWQSNRTIATQQQAATTGARRADTRWRRLSHAELAAEVGRAGGRVFIGLKDPDATAGVDERGRQLASASSVLSGKRMLRALGVRIDREHRGLPSVTARVQQGMLQAILSSPLVEYVEPLLPIQAESQSTPWNITRVNAPSAWSSATGSGIKLLVIDTGIDTLHADLAPAVVHNCDPYATSGMDSYGHGTQVSGVAAAVNNSVQIVGVSHGVSLWSSKANIGNTISFDPDYIVCSLEYGRDNDVHVINMSFSSADSYTAVSDQINQAWNEGIVLVAAAGNQASAVRWPAVLSSVIAVSATDSSDALAWFSNSGSKVEITAPGDEMSSTCLGTTTCGVQGTSFATPAVAAAAALLKSYNSGWSNYNIRGRLAVSASDLGTSGRDASFGYGMLNVASALSASPPSPPTASISGPNSVRPNVECTWTASVSNGLAPFAYAWFNQSIPAGSTLSVTTSMSSSGNLLFQVSDGINGFYAVSKSVTVSSSAPACLS